MSSFRNKQDSEKPYWQHDTRDNIRHVSFKSSAGNRNNRQRGWDNKIRKYMTDDDINMNTNITITKKFPNRFNPYKGNSFSGNYKNNFRKNGAGDRSGLSNSPSSWYKVTLGSGRKYDREELFKILQSRLKTQTLVPIGVKVEETDLTFYVDNFKIANSLLFFNLKIDLKDGWKLQIRVSPIMPFIEVNDVLKENIKTTMATRYNAAVNALNLSKFYADHNFLKADLFVPLNRQNVLFAVFQIIIESVPNLQSLDLSNNLLFTTEHFSLLKRHATNLKSLDLRSNKIRDIKSIKDLTGMDLEELFLDNNPLCEHFQDRATYVRELRKIFPKLSKLDGVTLPTAVTFGIDEEEKMPQAQGCYLCNTDARDIVKQFIEQYYIMYDNQESRQQLIDAYHETAQFSLSAYSVATGVNLSAYICDSRNLFKVTNVERKYKLLKRGKLEIVTSLESLPKTQHDPASFVVDVIQYTPEMIIITICGVFRETTAKFEDKKTFIRSFNRVFNLVPVGCGFKIIADQLLITHPSDKQLTTAFQCAADNVMSTNQHTSLSSPSAVSCPVPGQSCSVDAAEVARRSDMVRTLTTQTGMNLVWSEKCLNETNWDYNNAFNAFAEFHKQGSIPPEAFLSS